MKRFLIHLLPIAAGLYLADWLLPGIRLDSPVTLAFSTVVLAVVNALIRPILLLLTLPITVLTLGLFYFVVNGLAFGLAAAIVPGFQVASIGSAILGAFVVGLVAWVYGMLFRDSPETKV